MDADEQERIMSAEQRGETQDDLSQARLAGMNEAIELVENSADKFGHTIGEKIIALRELKALVQARIEAMERERDGR